MKKLLVLIAFLFSTASFSALASGDALDELRYDFDNAEALILDCENRISEIDEQLPQEIKKLAELRRILYSQDVEEVGILANIGARVDVSNQKMVVFNLKAEKRELKAEIKRIKNIVENYDELEREILEK